MKILKIKRGFITNSSGSYEWIPPVDTNQGSNNSDAAKPPQNRENVNNNSERGKNGAGIPAVSVDNSSLTKAQHSYNKADNLENTGNKISRKELDPSVIVLGALFVVLVVVIIIWKIIRKLFRKSKLIKK